MQTYYIECLYYSYHKHLCRQMPLHTEHTAVMRAMMLYDALVEFCPTAVQGFLVTVCLPTNMKY